MFDKWAYVTTGFLQTRGTCSRMVMLWQQLHEQFCDERRAIELCAWKSDWTAQAEFVFRLSNPNPTITSVNYSWGAGYGLVKFARALQKRGLEIQHAALIDPVYRHGYLLGQWRTFIPQIPIIIPANVKRVTWWRQNMTWPRGHDLIAERPRSRANPDGTIIDDARVIRADHVHMDDQPEILNRCYEICKAGLI